MFVYQGIRNISFLENFAYVLNEWSLGTLSLQNIKNTEKTDLFKL